MKLLIVIVTSLVLGIALAVTVIALISSQLPKEHSATRSIVLHRSPTDVYRAIRNFESAPTWPPDVKSIQVVPQPNGGVRFREQGKHGAVNYEVVEDIPEQLMVTRILDTNLGYSGKWTYRSE